MELLGICMSDGILGKRGLVTLRKMRAEFLAAFLYEDAFFSAVSMVFNETVNVNTVSRAASITLLMIKKFPQKSGEFSGIVFQFLPYCYESGVLDLFEQIFAQSTSLAIIQNTLVEVGFGKIIVKTISECESNNFELLTNLLIIVRNAAENDVLKKSVRTKEMMNAIKDLPRNESVLVLNELWKTIYELTCSDLKSECVIFIDKAVSNVCEVYNNINPFRVFSLDFLAKLLSFQDEQFKCILELQIQQVILRLIVQFPNSSNLMGAVFRLIENSIKWPLFTNAMANHFVPLMVTEALNNKKDAVTANCFSTIDKLNELRKSNKPLNDVLKEIDMFDSFVTQNLRKYNNILNNNYGGSHERTLSSYHSSSFFLLQ